MIQACTVTGTPFEITHKDIKFYEEMSVPPPTLCPEERARRRLSWRNDRTFYKRKCDATGKVIIAMYPPHTSFPVYHQSAWWTDSWDPLLFGRDFDFSRSFFSQWKDLMMVVPRLGMDIVNCENSDYCNYCGDDKNCYIDIAGERNEESFFGLFTKYSTSVCDTTFVYNGELVYEAISCYGCYNIQFCKDCENSSDCAYCFDLKGCQNCFMCTGLRNKKYCIENKQYPKEEYLKIANQKNFSSFLIQQKAKKRWLHLMSSAKHKYAQILNSENCTGDNINSSKNTFDSFNALNCEDCRYLYDVLDAKDCRDLNYSLYNPEMSCELISTLQMHSSAYSLASHYCYDVFYCDLCNSTKNCFGCIGLKQKEYCILNTQYSKEEYFALRTKIIEHMKHTGEWGQFFPIEISPFGYNETVANEYFPLTKEEVLQKGWKCKDDEPSAQYNGPKIQIPETISNTPDSICDQILECEQCSKNYRLVKPELQFYRTMNLPVPHVCPNCRHLNRMKFRNPRKLFKRNCTNCGTHIETTYSFDRPEKVLCEKCYEQSVI